MEDERLFGEMVSQADERALDVYLYLLKESHGRKNLKMTLNLKKIAELLGIDGMGNTAYRRQIIKVLRKLRDKYRLLDFQKPGKNKNAVVSLKNLKNGRKPAASSGRKVFTVPAGYFNYGWNRKLSLGGKAFYLISLMKTSKANPSWFMSRRALSKRFHVSEAFITAGTRELKSANLLEVQYDMVSPGSLRHRLANVYTLLKLYDPARLEEKIKELEAEYGSEKVLRARRHAALVFQENNARIVETMIDLEEEYGRDVVEKAAKKMTERNTDNPKRSAGYFIGTVRAIGEERPKSLEQNPVRPRVRRWEKIRSGAAFNQK